MKALVTGGTGFVGGGVVRELVRRGHRVRVLARPTSRIEHLESLAVEIALGDILDPQSIDSGLSGCDLLFHVAAIYEFFVRDRKLLMRTEVEGTRNVLEAAVRSGVRQVIYTSTALAVGESRGATGSEDTPHRGYFLSPYEEAKYRAEQVARSFEDRIRLCILRPAAVLGPGDLKTTGQLILNLANRRMLAVIPGALSVVDVEDVAVAHVRTAELGISNQTYVLAAGVYSTRQLARSVCAFVGIRPPFVVPVLFGRILAGIEELRARLMGGRPLLTRGEIELTAHGFRVDGSKARRELGLEYRSLNETLSGALEWYWKEGLLKRSPKFPPETPG